MRSHFRIFIAGKHTLKVVSALMSLNTTENITFKTRSDRIWNLKMGGGNAIQFCFVVSHQRLYESPKNVSVIC